VTRLRSAPRATAGLPAEASWRRREGWLARYIAPERAAWYEARGWTIKPALGVAGCYRMLAVRLPLPKRSRVGFAQAGRAPVRRVR